MLNIFRGYVGYPRIYTIPRQLLPLRVARYFIVHRSLGEREKWLIRPRDSFSLLFCNLSPDIREISVENLVLVMSNRREREREGRRESIKRTISSFDTFNLAAADS